MPCCARLAIRYNVCRCTSVKSDFSFERPHNPSARQSATMHGQKVLWVSAWLASVIPDELPSSVPSCGVSSVCFGQHDRGEVFVLHEGMQERRPVCDDGWDRTDADVACKEAGFPRGALKATTSGSSLGLNYAMDEVSCDGSEAKLRNCRHSQRHDCGPSEAAGAVCDSATEQELRDEKEKLVSCFANGVTFSLADQIGDSITLSTSVRCQQHCAANSNCLQFSYNTASKMCSIYSAASKMASPYEIGGPRNCTTGPPPDLQAAGCAEGICLMGGTGSEGNVYVDGTPVCDDGWSEAEADVVCKQLNFTGGALRFTTASKFGLVTAPHSRVKYSCRGGEAELAACAQTPGEECDSGEGAGATCDDREAAVVERERKCFIRGISYHNRRAVLGLTSPPTPTAAECQKACQGAVLCTHFTWLFLGGKCKLFRVLDVPGESPMELHNPFLIILSQMSAN